MSIVKNAGRVACVPRGTYDSTETYNRLDIVAYAGNAYICKVDNTTGVLPTNTAKWIIVMDGGATYLLLSNKVNLIKEKTDHITVSSNYIEFDKPLHDIALEGNITLNGEDFTDIIAHFSNGTSGEVIVNDKLVTQEDIVIDGAKLDASEVNTNDLYINNVSKTEALDMLSVSQSGDLCVNGSLTVDADITNTGGGINTAYIETDLLETNSLIIDGADRAPALSLLTKNSTYLQTDNLQVQNSLVVGTHNVANELQTLNEKMVKCTQAQYDTWSALG